MIFPEITINSQLIIEPKTPEYPGRYLSKVEDFDDNLIYISVPVSQQHLVPIRVGTILDIYFTEGPKSYHFESMVIERKAEPFPLLAISRPKQLDQKERRQFMRGKVKLPILVKINSPEARESLGLKDGIKGFTRNVSAGGLLFDSHLPLPSGLILQIEIQFPAFPLPCMVLARIIRTIDLTKGNGKYGVAVKFVIVEEKVRNELLKFIFDAEREKPEK